jgi:SAM-dependent methyltransferase
VAFKHNGVTIEIVDHGCIWLADSIHHPRHTLATTESIIVKHRSTTGHHPGPCPVKAQLKVPFASSLSRGISAPRFIRAIYERRIIELTGLDKRNRVWCTLCNSFFDTLIGPDKDVLDLACGYGEFINNVSAKSKTAIDLNPDAKRHLGSDVRFVHCSALELTMPAATQDVVFASNFLEHLRDKNELVLLFAQVRRVLRDNGHFIVMGPNIKYAYKEYWVFLIIMCRYLTFRWPRDWRQTANGRKNSNLRLDDTALFKKNAIGLMILGKQFLIVAERRN